jgi:MOSC domain-containing protein YiiM
MTTTLVSQEEILQHWDHLQSSPTDNGTLSMLVVRREVDHREIRQELYVSPEGGIEGDRWAQKSHQDPEHHAQIAIMNDRVLRLIADNDPNRMALAGDQMVVDFNLHESNVPAGTRLRIGEAEFEVTPKLHKGCKKFAARFGTEALKLINSVPNRPYHMRGIYLRVTKAGVIRTGDTIQKL